MTQVTAWDRNGVYGVNNPDFDEICTYGSSYKQSATAFTKNTVTSSIYATDLAERTIYGPTARLNYETGNESYYAKPFLPAFLIGVQLPVAASAELTYSYEAEIAFDLVFRGTRYDNKT